MQDVILLTGAGQIGLAIARRMGHGKKIVVSDKNIKNILIFMNTYDMIPLKEKGVAAMKR